MGKLFFNSEQQITFQQTQELNFLIPEIYHPVPASLDIPEWYKKIPAHFPPENETETVPTSGRVRRETLTIKKCMPVFDSFTAGYLIKTYCDIDITQNNGTEWSMDWSIPDQNNIITSHPFRQFYNYKDKKNETPAPKWNNPWIIKTPPNYSCLFIPPLHRPNTGIKILEGIVDTDKYPNAVLFPFWIDAGFTGLIPAGTPIAQVIPFKRDNFKMKIDTTEKSEKRIVGNIQLFSLWHGGYKKFYRSNKSYR